METVANSKILKRLSEIEEMETAEHGKAWSVNETDKNEMVLRLSRVRHSFYEFDKEYFTDDLHSDGFSEYADFHHELIKIMDRNGVNIVLAARKHGKTAIAKKYAVWQLVTGKKFFIGTLSQTLTTATNILEDIATLIQLPKIRHDFGIKFTELNTEQFTFRVRGERLKRRCMAFSEGRSVRGATFIFSRPQWILCDDLETRQSGMSEAQTTKRINIIKESFQSMSENGTLLVLGNNFDERGAMNRLLQEKKAELLPKSWNVDVFPAWSNNAPLWFARFPARTELELKTILGVTDISEWLSEFQQQPQPPDGFIFQRHDFLPTYLEIPNDSKGVIYCDPNLSKKGKGDTTAIVKLLFSPNTQRYYIADFVCRSFGDSDELLNTVLGMYDNTAKQIAFDGNVNQESTWTNNVRNWCRIRQAPFPRIEYKRYRTDDLAKNLQSAWAKKEILFPNRESEDIKRALSQIYAFNGKKFTSGNDDAPDALICAYEFIQERGLSSVKKRVSFAFDSKPI